jgi:hypothetical protein
MEYPGGVPGISGIGDATAVWAVVSADLRMTEGVTCELVAKNNRKNV